MQLIKSRDFKADKAWGSLDIERLDDASIRLHWTDQPYKWHVNEGPEVFALLAGQVNMHARLPDGTETVFEMKAGDIFHAEEGDAHVAHPVGEARILVIEKTGSV